MCDINDLVHQYNQSRDMAACHYNAFLAYLPTMGVTPKEVKSMESNSRDQTKISNRFKRLQNSVMMRVNKGSPCPLQQAQDDVEYEVNTVGQANIVGQANVEQTVPNVAQENEHVGQANVGQASEGQVAMDQTLV